MEPTVSNNIEINLYICIPVISIGLLAELVGYIVILVEFATP